MTLQTDMRFRRITDKLRALPLIGIFFEKNFFHYTWIGIAISLLNIFLLWLFIDEFHVPTVLASSTVVVGTFIIRYLLLRTFRIMG